MRCEIKKEKKDILVRPILGMNYLRMPETKIDGHGELVKCIQWINFETAQSWWAVNRIRTQMLGVDDGYLNKESSEFQIGSHENWKSRLVEYNKPSFFYCSSCNSTSPYIYLVDEEGKVLSGSNVFSGGNLCLGVDSNPITDDPIRVFMSNMANKDLDWVGEPFKGEWNEENELKFVIQSWKSTTIHIERVPQFVLCATNAWSQS